MGWFRLGVIRSVPPVCRSALARGVSLVGFGNEVFEVGLSFAGLAIRALIEEITSRNSATTLRAIAGYCRGFIGGRSSVLPSCLRKSIARPIAARSCPICRCHALRAASRGVDEGAVRCCEFAAVSVLPGCLCEGIADRSFRVRLLGQRRAGLGSGCQPGLVGIPL